MVPLVISSCLFLCPPSSPSRFRPPSSPSRLRPPSPPSWLRPRLLPSRLRPPSPPSRLRPLFPPVRLQTPSRLHPLSPPSRFHPLSPPSPPLSQLGPTSSPSQPQLRLPPDPSSCTSPPVSFEACSPPKPPKPPDPPDVSLKLVQSRLRLRGKQNHLKPMLPVKLPVWMLVLCPTAPVSFAAMAVNCFSGESPDEIFSGAFLQPIRARCAFVPLWRCLLTSSSNLSASVKPPVAIACFFCSRSFQCTDLKFHRLLPSSSAMCPMNSVPKGMTSSALLWCERSIRSDRCNSNQAHKDECSLSQSLLDFTDQRLDVGSVKSPWLQHSNAGVRIFCLNSILALSESIDKPISLSYVKVKSSEVHTFLFGAISGVNSKYPSKAHHQRHASTNANIKPSLLLGWSLLKLEDCSSLAFFLSKKASQTSSCRGHERSLSIFLLFVGLKSSIKTPLCVRTFLLVGLSMMQKRHLHT